MTRTDSILVLMLGVATVSGGLLLYWELAGVHGEFSRLLVAGVGIIGFVGGQVLTRWSHADGRNPATDEERQALSKGAAWGGLVLLLLAWLTPPLVTASIWAGATGLLGSFLLTAVWRLSR